MPITSSRAAVWLSVVLADLYRTGGPVEGSNARVTSQFFRVRNCLELVGGNDYFRRCGRANARNGSDPGEQLPHTVVGFINLFVNAFHISVDGFEQCPAVFRELFLEPCVHTVLLFGDRLLDRGAGAIADEPAKIVGEDY